MEYSETVPVQYQRGYTDFMGFKIKVDPRVLIPRPETEILIKEAARILNGTCEKCKVLDLCTGSGVIAIGLCGILSGAEVLASDISPEALEVASSNIESSGFGGRIRVLRSDMFSGLENEMKSSFDAIVANPPYVSDRDIDLLDPWVKAEPEIALYAGKNGMDHINVICCQAPLYIKEGGFLALEIGYDQASLVTEKMISNGFSGIRILKDRNGFSRVAIGWKNG